jgi:flagellar hook-associated protein 2
VTLNLVHATASGGSATTVNVTRDPATTATKVQALVDALNGVLSEIKKDTAYDTNTKKGQPLNGDPTARGIADNLLSQVLSATGTGTFVKALSQLGIQTTRDGALTFDSGAFQKAVQQDPDGAAALTASFAKGVETYAKTTTDFDGIVTTAGKAAGDDAASRQKNIDAFEVRMTAMEQAYTAKFAALDALLGTLKAQQSTLASALAGLPTGSSG